MLFVGSKLTCKYLQLAHSLFYTIAVVFFTLGGIFFKKGKRKNKLYQHFDMVTRDD